MSKRQSPEEEPAEEGHELLAAAWELARPLLFQLEPEFAHEMGLGSLAALSGAPGLLELTGRLLAHEDQALAMEVLGHRFGNPLGLAAGCDKEARAVPALAALGFGFVEIGTVTPMPQPGNPRPRMFRLPAERALVNRLGFNSEGARAVASRLDGASRARCRLGVNIGKNRWTPTERAGEDYEAALRELEGGDYLVINVSSPNTPGLRDLLGERELRALLDVVVHVESELAEALDRPARPILVKLSPDLSDDGLAAAVDVAAERGAAGLIATNTTLSRPAGSPANPVSPAAAEAGGLSGAPQFARTLEVVRSVYRRVEGKLAIIGVGGVSSAEDAWRLMRAGASLVQVYSGFVYGGPLFPRRILQGLSRRLAGSRERSLAEIVGSDAS